MSGGGKTQEHSPSDNLRSVARQVLYVCAVILLFCACVTFGSLGGSELLKFVSGGSLGGSGTLRALIATSTVYAIASISLLLTAFYLFKQKWATLGITQLRKWNYLLLLPVIYLGYFSFSISVIATLSVLVPSLQGGPVQELGFTPKGLHELLLSAILLIIVAPVFEELIFRGYLFGLLRQRSPLLVAAFVTSIFFGLAHLTNFSSGTLYWLLALDTFFLSIVLCWLREKTGTIWVGMGLHALKNSVAFVLLFIVKASS